jgi:hypothetical protein
MAAIFLVLIGGYFAFDATHHTVLAYIFLANALLLVHPIRAVVLFCLAAVGTALIALLNLVMPRRRSRRELLDDPPPAPPHPAPSSRSPAGPVAPAPASLTAPDPAGASWQGQASPFLDWRGRHLDDKP